MPTRKNRTELEFQLRARKVDRAAAVTETLIRFGSLVAIFALVASAMKAYAGETTFAQVGFAFVGDLKINEWLAYVLAGGGITYGLKQRKARRDQIEQMG